MCYKRLLRFKIGNNIGRTGFVNRGPNDRRPVVYFHVASCASYIVYKYCLYYADNDWLNDHKHDWEKYFVYLEDSTPRYIKLSSHYDFNTYSWNLFSEDNDYPRIRFEGGSHAMNDNDEYDSPSSASWVRDEWDSSPSS